MALTIREWQERYDAGGLLTQGEQADAGWAEWACKDSTLITKTKALAKLIMRLADGGKLDLDNARIRFRNIDPDDGGAFDEIMFYDRTNGGTYMICTSDEPQARFNDGGGDGMKWHVYLPKEKEYPLTASFQTVTDLARWLNMPFQNNVRRAGFTTKNGEHATQAELVEAAVLHAKALFGVDVEFTGVQRKTFRTEGQAEIWLSSRYEFIPIWAVYIASYGDEHKIAYCIEV